MFRNIHLSEKSELSAHLLQEMSASVPNPERVCLALSNLSMRATTDKRRHRRTERQFFHIQHGRHAENGKGNKQ